jgi:O-antigen/teichoic acid export membrane protein
MQLLIASLALVFGDEGKADVTGTASALMARAWKQVRDPSAALLATQLTSIVLRLGSNLILARLLVPRDFGLLAITTLIATALALLFETGAWVSIVRKGDDVDRNWLDQLWTLHAIRGVLLWVIALGLAPFVARAYGEPQLLTLLPVANLWLVILGLESLHPFVRNKDLRPGMSLTLQLVTQGAGSIFSIFGALIYPSPWALVGGLLAGAAASTILGHVWSSEPLPRPRITRPFLQEQWTLAKWLIVSTALGFFGGQIDRLLFPLWFGTTAFGVYSVALTLALFPLGLGQRWADSVYMPAIAKLSQTRSAASERQLRTLCRHVVIYGAVASALLAGIGAPFFHALYPRQFWAAGLFIQILAVTTYVSFITHLHRRAFLYQGMTRLEASIEASRVFLFLGVLGMLMVLERMPSAAEYVALFAAVQVVVYGGLMLVGKLKQLVHLRDDLPGHLVFVALTVTTAALDGVLERQLGAWAALLALGLLGGVIGLATAWRLGLPKLPETEAEPKLPPHDLAAAPEILDPIRET